MLNFEKKKKIKKNGNWKFHALKEPIEQYLIWKKCFKYFIGYANHFNDNTTFITKSP